MRVTQYLAEKKRWDGAGNPLRSPEEIKAIHEICQECPFFMAKKGLIPGYDKCGKCGCNLHPSNELLNKIAWGTTRCPDNPPRWTESND